MSPGNEASANVSADVYERERVGNLRPSGWRNPQPDGSYQLAIVGAGPAGVVAAELAASVGVRVALIERNAIGGVNLSAGSVPSKTLIRTSRIYADMRDAQHYGANVPDDVDVDFAAAMERVWRVRARQPRRFGAATGAAASTSTSAKRSIIPDMLAVDSHTLGFRRR
jgi:thioredoxin reductase